MTRLVAIPPIEEGSRVYVPPGSSSEKMKCRTGTTFRAENDGWFVQHDDGNIYGWSTSELRLIASLTLWRRFWLSVKRLPPKTKTRHRRARNAWNKSRPKGNVLKAIVVALLFSTGCMGGIPVEDEPEIDILELVDLSNERVFVYDETLGILELGITPFEFTAVAFDCQLPSIKDLSVHENHLRAIYDDWFLVADISGDCQLAFNIDTNPIGISADSNGIFLLTDDGNDSWISLLAWPEEWPNANAIQNVSASVVAEPLGMFRYGTEYYTFNRFGALRSFEPGTSLSNSTFNTSFDAVVRVGDVFLYWDDNHLYVRDEIGNFVFEGQVPYTAKAAAVMSFQ